MPNYGRKRAVYEAMPQAYEEASDGGRLPALARMVAYALRRVTGLGDALDMDYVLNAGGVSRRGLIEDYLEDHPEETADWDIVRDARGSFSPPYGQTVPLGTLDVRRYIEGCRSWAPGDGDDRAPELSLYLPTRGPGDLYGAVLYIEKEGFDLLLRAERLAERWDIGIVGSKGYSIRAARALLRECGLAYGLHVFVAHDFDQQGVGIYDLIRREVPGAVDLGLRAEDIEDERWGLAAQSETVKHRADPLDNLVERGATPDEIAFLRESPKAGRRVELNALTGRRFIDWLEAKLEAHGVRKVVPDETTLAAAYRHAYANARANEVIAKAHEQAKAEAVEIDVPDGLASRVAGALTEHRTQTWDIVIADLAKRRNGGS
jgi:hypothetical protein